MTFIRTALAIALVAALSVPATASPVGYSLFPTLTWPDASSPAEPGDGK
ncbi:hypothetical protein [Halocynthiibacter sp.]